MTQYWDIFGSDDFHSTYNDSDSRLSDHASYIENNATSQYEDQVSDTVIVTDHGSNDYTVSVSGNDLASRRTSASMDLYNNYSSYNASSICMVFDYGTYSGKATAGGIGGVNQPDAKVCMVNAYQMPTGKGSGSFVACHEIGHCIGAEHKHVSYHSDPCNHADVSQYVSYGYKAGTFLHSPSSVSPTCLSKGDSNVDYTVPGYSGCTENKMEK